MSEHAPTTMDRAHAGRVTLEQPAHGYRFNADSIYLAARAAADAPGSALDVGAGVGVVALCLADRVSSVRLTLVEREPLLAGCARRNLERASSATGDVVGEVVERDVRTWSDGRRFDVVVMNPPYYRPNDGRINPDPVRAVARHQLHGSLEELVAAAARRVALTGALHVVYPASGALEVLAAAAASGLRRASLRFVHPNPTAEARSVLVRTAPAARASLAVEAPLFCYDSSGERSTEADDLWNGR